MSILNTLKRKLRYLNFLIFSKNIQNHMSFPSSRSEALADESRVKLIHERATELILREFVVLILQALKKPLKITYHYLFYSFYF